MDILNEENARKVMLDAQAAWALLSEADAVLTARGKTLRRWDPKADDREDILADVMGRSGNLRAPTIRIGNVFLVGFNEEMYRAYLGAAA